MSLLLERVTVLEIEKMVVSTSRYFNCASLIMKLLNQFGIKDQKKGFIFSVLQEAWREQDLSREATDRYYFNSLTPNSDRHLISPHNTTPESNIRVTRIKEMITN